MDLSKLEEDAARAARDALNVDGTFDVRSPDECSLDDREQSEWDATVRATRAVLAIALAAAAEEAKQAQFTDDPKHDHWAQACEEVSDRLRTLATQLGAANG